MANRRIGTWVAISLIDEVDQRVTDTVLVTQFNISNFLDIFKPLYRVFEAIATHCSGVAAKVTADLADARAEVARTMADRRGPQHYG